MKKGYRKTPVCL